MATQLMTSFAIIVATMVCQTDNPTATSEEPTCQLLRHISGIRLAQVVSRHNHPFLELTVNGPEADERIFVPPAS